MAFVVRGHLFMVSPNFTPISPWNCSLSSPISSTVKHSETIIWCLRRRWNIASIFCNAELHNLETSLSWRIDLRLQTTTQCDCQAASKPLLRHNDKNRVETQPDFAMKLLTFVTNLKRCEEAQWGHHLMVSEGGETLRQSFVMLKSLNSITLKPHCPRKVICAFKLRHNVIAKSCVTMKPLWNSKKDSQREWLLVIPLLTVWIQLSHSTLHSFVTHKITFHLFTEEGRKNSKVTALESDSTVGEKGKKTEINY